MKYGIAVLLVLLLRAITPYTMVMHVDTGEAERYLFMNQLLASSLVLEKDGYAHVGVLDPAKISTLDQRITYDHRLAAKIILSNATGTLNSEGFFQEEWYKLWSVLVGKRGPGGTVKEEKIYYVLYQEGEKLIPGTVKIDVVMPIG